MRRRQFVRTLAGATGAFLAASRALPGAQTALAPTSLPGHRRVLILVELRGGNDAWNTVVPYRDPAYYRARPGLALSARDVVPLDAHRALHGALSPVHALWTRGELALVGGVGSGALTHFRAMHALDGFAERGDAGRRAGPLGDGSSAHCGWLARALTDRDAHCISFGSDPGPLTGATGVGRVHPRGDPFGAAQASLPALVDAVRAGRWAVLHLVLDGFDTHYRQAERHATLLGAFATGLASLRDALTQAGLWRDTLIVAGSEFGRSLAENAVAGTEHGERGMQFAAGGAVRGGFHGAWLHPGQAGAPDAAALVDPRALHATILTSFFRLRCDVGAGLTRRPLDVLAR
jgi:uncharacterized protein (DUF1501 family)